jgi:hypothetical protein
MTHKLPNTKRFVLPVFFMLALHPRPCHPSSPSDTSRTNKITGNSNIVLLGFLDETRTG